MLEETLREWEKRKLDEGRRSAGGPAGRSDSGTGAAVQLGWPAFRAATGTELAGVLAGVEDSNELARVARLFAA